jgi:hypothetical protein
MAMSEFTSEFKKWGRFQLVGSFAEADLVMELRFALQHSVEAEYRTYNFYTQRISVQSAPYAGPTLALVISGLDPIVLTDSGKHKSSGRENDDHSETTKSADRLVEQLRTRFEACR